MGKFDRYDKKEKQEIVDEAKKLHDLGHQLVAQAVKYTKLSSEYTSGAEVAGLAYLSLSHALDEEFDEDTDELPSDMREMVAKTFKGGGGKVIKLDKNQGKELKKLLEELTGEEIEDE